MINNNRIDSIKAIIKDNIDNILHFNLIKQNELCEILNINYTNFSNQKNNGCIPNDILISIANLFSLNQDFILGYTDIKTNNDNTDLIKNDIINLQILLSMLQYSTTKPYDISCSFNVRLYELYLIYNDKDINTYKILNEIIDINKYNFILNKKDFRKQYENKLINITLDNSLLTNIHLIDFFNCLWIIESPYNLQIKDIFQNKVINSNITRHILDTIDNNKISIFELFKLDTLI